MVLACPHLCGLNFGARTKLIFPLTTFSVDLIPPLLQVLMQSWDYSHIWSFSLCQTASVQILENLIRYVSQRGLVEGKVLSLWRHGLL